MSEAPNTSTDCGGRDRGSGTTMMVIEAPAVSVGMTDGRGRGLFASKAMAKGDTVLIERPLVAMQSLDNAQDVMVCRNCLGFAGDTVSQLELLSGVPRQECVEHFERRRQSKDPVSARSEDFSGLHSCLQGCGEVYCSPKCRTEHFERCHHLLCVGPVPEEEAHTHPLVEFRVHAMQTNEIFLLVGEVLVQVVSCFLRDGGDLMKAQAPFADFVQEPWWEVAISRETEAGANPSSLTATSLLHDTLRVLCEESSALLRKALALPLALEQVLTTERFGRVVGMFEQNNVGIRAPSPILAALQEVIKMGGEGVAVNELATLVSSLEIESECLEEDDCNEEENGECCSSTREEAGEDDAEDADGSAEDPIGLLKTAVESGDTEALFAPLDGTALYSLICCMNHSCRPNCVVRYPGRKKFHGGEAEPLVAQVVLLEKIDAGKELTQSYVDQTMGLVERRAALQDYGFFCRCLRCTEEEGIV